jgi:hypothetical protein
MGLFNQCPTHHTAVMAGTEGMALPVAVTQYVLGRDHTREEASELLASIFAAVREGQPSIVELVNTVCCISTIFSMSTIFYGESSDIQDCHWSPLDAGHRDGNLSNHRGNLDAQQRDPASC